MLARATWAALIKRTLQPPRALSDGEKRDGDKAECHQQHEQQERIADDPKLMLMSPDPVPEVPRPTHNHLPETPSR
jgi:hypothetical protein